MWCSCCTPEEQEEWENHLKYVSCNVNRLRKLGKKCIVNKQIGRKNYNLDNDFVECFQKLERSLLDLKKMSVDFLISDSIFQEVKEAQMHRNYLRLQQQLLEVKHQRAAVLNLNNTELQAGSSRRTSSDFRESKDMETPLDQLETNEIAILNEIVDNLRRKLHNREREVEVLKARIRKLELQWQVQSSESLTEEDGEKEGAVSQVEAREAYQSENQEDESGLSSLLKDVAVTGADTLVRGFMNNLFKDGNEPCNSANMMQMVPLKRNKMKDPLSHGQKKQSKKNPKNRTKSQSSDDLVQNMNEGGNNSRAPRKIFKKISEGKTKVINKEASTNKSIRTKGGGDKSSKSATSVTESGSSTKKKKK